MTASEPKHWFTLKPTGDFPNYVLTRAYRFQFIRDITDCVGDIF